MEAQLKKELGVVGVMSIFAVIECAAFAVLLRPAFSSVLIATVLALLTVIWLALLAIALAQVRHIGSVLVLVLVPAAVMVGVGGLSGVAISAAVLFCALAAFARRTFTQEVQNRIYYRTTHVFATGLRLLTLGALVGLVGLSWTTLTGTDGVYAFNVTEQHIEPFLKPLTPLISRSIPGFQPSLSIDQLIQQQLQKQADSLPEGIVIPPEQLRISREELGDQLGEDLKGNETLTTIVTSKLNNYITGLTEQNVVLVTFVLLVLVFLTLRALLPFLVWPLLGVVALLVQLLRAAGVLTLTETQAPVQRLEL